MKIRNIKRSKSPDLAASLVEYALLIALIGSVCVASVKTTGTKVACIFASASKMMQEGSLPSGPWSGYGANNCTGKGSSGGGSSSTGGNSSGYSSYNSYSSDGYSSYGYSSYGYSSYGYSSYGYSSDGYSSYGYSSYGYSSNAYSSYGYYSSY